MKQYLEYKDDKSSKFWEITINNTVIITRYGKIGANGQLTEKIYATQHEAKKEYDKLVNEKLKKGYKKISNSSKDTQNAISNSSKPKTISLEKAKRIIAKSPFKLNKSIIEILESMLDSSDDSEIEYYDGNILLNNYEVFCVTIVQGNMEVKGLLKDGINDHSLLIVLGDLTIDRMISVSEIAIGGNLKINDIAAFDSLGDYTLTVNGDIMGKYFIESDQNIELKGKWKVEKKFRRGEDAKKVFVSKALTEEGDHDFAEMVNLIEKGKPVFKK